MFHVSPKSSRYGRPKKDKTSKYYQKWAIEMTTQCLSEGLVCDRIFQDKDNDSTWRQKVFDSIFSCHQKRVTLFMPPQNDTLQHSIAFAMSPLICAFKPKNTFTETW